MVLKSSSVLLCLLPTRLGFGSNHRPDSPSRPRNQEKHAEDLHHHPAGPVAHDRLGEAELDPFRGISLPLHQVTDPDPSGLPRPRANTEPSGSLRPPPLIPNSSIGRTPSSIHRHFFPPNRSKRSSCTTFFAFSSKRKSTHAAPIIHLPQPKQELRVPPLPGSWVSDNGHAEVHLISPSAVPSPLRTDEEYYYSYYASLTPSPSHPISPHPDTTNIPPSKRLSSRQQEQDPDLDSPPSSPADSRPSHTQVHHPYAYPTLLYSKPYSSTIDTVPPLRHATSQPFRHHFQASRSETNARFAPGRIPPPQLGHEVSSSQPHLSRPELKTSKSTPNLASGAAPVRPTSVIKKKPSTRSKGQERWLSAETWWDALLSPSPRFKAKQVPRPHTANGRGIHDPVGKPVEGEQDRNLGVTFPSIPAIRPRTASVTSNVRPTPPALTRSRSAADLLGEPSTSANLRAGFEPALEPLVDEPTPIPDQVPGGDAELSLPDPPLSLEQVIDEGEAFEQQRAQWKHQASRSLGNKHARSLSRARSKSLGARHVHGHHTSEKASFNLEFLAARTLLGSQTTKPTVHISKPSNSSSHSKAYSHSHSQSAYSYTHTSRSRVYSHSHSHSLTTSNSSKSSRMLLPCGHSRNESWSKTAFLKAGSLCGIGQDEPYGAFSDEKVPSSSRVDMHGIIYPGDSTNAEGVSDSARIIAFQSVPIGEVGVAITSTPPLEGPFDLNVSGHPYVSAPQYQEGDHESRWSSRHTHKSSVYAGPHPSAIDSSLPQLVVASNVSMRHRLPPRAAIHPPIAPIAHPYRSTPAQPEQGCDKGSEGDMLKVTEGQGAGERNTGRTLYPHISLSHANFEQYGVGEALVYASLPRPEEVPEVRQANVESETSPAIELPPPEEQSSLRETVVLHPEVPDTPLLAMDSPPSLTNSTIQMVMSAFDDPDDLQEFQDLFYKPHPTSEGRHQDSSMNVNQVPTDVRGSVSSSPIIHFVRKLSKEVHIRQDPSRAPYDPTRLQGSELQDPYSNESRTKFVFMDLARSSSSPLPMESSSQMHLPIQKEGESTTQPVMVVPEDVSSSYTVSVLESPLEERENDTFGYPIKRGQFEAATTPSPVHSPLRVPTHFSIQEDEAEEDESAFLSPVTKRYGMSSIDVVRSSYLTTSDASQMSGLSDFPLPPSTRSGGQSSHASILQAYSDATLSSESQRHSQCHDEDEIMEVDRYADGEEDEGPSSDIKETLRVLRMTSHAASCESRRSTFGGSDDMDFITQLHQVQRS